MRETVERPPPAGPLRVAWSLVAGWLFTFAFCTVAVLASLLTFRQLTGTLAPALLRFWGRGILWIQGVRLQVEGAEHLSGQAMRVATFNHSSNLDAMIIPALTPRGGVAAIKREAMYIPFVGAALYMLGFLIIDRGRSERARRTLGKAARRMEKEQLTVFLAPEGTRSRKGTLQPFRRGAFHLAVASGAPIVPIVIRGAYDLYPAHRWAARPGVVHVRILPPIPIAELAAEGVPAAADALRAIYVRELGEAPTPEEGP